MRKMEDGRWKYGGWRMEDGRREMEVLYIDLNFIY
jgi:hypothetical protein